MMWRILLWIRFRGTEACVAGFGTLGLASDKGLSDGDIPSSYNCVGQWFE